MHDPHHGGAHSAVEQRAALFIAQFTIIIIMCILHRVKDGKPMHKRNATAAGAVFACGESGFLGGKNIASS